VYRFSAASFHPAPAFQVRRSKVPLALAPPAPLGVCRLGAGEARRLWAHNASSLQVFRGVLWVTRNVSEQTPSDDIFLGAGDALIVAKGESILIEPWDRHGASYHWDAQPA